MSRPRRRGSVSKRKTWSIWDKARGLWVSQFHVFITLKDFYEIWCKQCIGWHASFVMFSIQQLIRTTWHLSGEGSTVTWCGIWRSPSTDYYRSKTNILVKRTAFVWVITQRLAVINYNFGSLITNDARYTRENKSIIVYGNSTLLQQEDCFYQQNELKFREETTEMLLLGYGYAVRWIVDTSASSSVIPRKFCNVVLT